MNPDLTPELTSSDRDAARRWRNQMARWKFYGELGTLRLVQSKMLGLSEMWPRDSTVQRLTGEIDARVIALREAILAHKDDWRGEAPHPPRGET